MPDFAAHGNAGRLLALTPQTLWYLESYLNDMEMNLVIRTESYLLAKRLHHTCQTIVFSETTTTSQELIHDLVKTDIVKSAHVPPSIVGMGLLLASVGAPVAHLAAQPLVVTQAKQPRFFNPLDDSGTRSDSSSDSDDGLSRAALGDERTQQRRKILSRIMARVPTTSPSLDELSKGSAFSFRNYVEKTETANMARYVACRLIQNPICFRIKAH